MPLFKCQYSMFNLLMALAVAFTIYQNTDQYKDRHCTDDGCPSWHENQE